MWHGPTDQPAAGLRVEYRADRAAAAEHPAGELSDAHSGAASASRCAAASGAFTASAAAGLAASAASALPLQTAGDFTAAPSAGAATPRPGPSDSALGHGTGHGRIAGRRA